MNFVFLRFLFPLFKFGEGNPFVTRRRDFVEWPLVTKFPKGYCDGSWTRTKSPFIHSISYEITRKYVSRVWLVSHTRFVTRVTIPMISFVFSVGDGSVSNIRSTLPFCCVLLFLCNVVYSLSYHVVWSPSPNLSWPSNDKWHVTVSRERRFCYDLDPDFPHSFDRYPCRSRTFFFFFDLFTTTCGLYSHTNHLSSVSFRRVHWLFLTHFFSDHHRPPSI